MSGFAGAYAGPFVRKRGAHMLYSVKFFPDGKWDGKPNHNVDAKSPKEAAEKLSGAALREHGSNDKIRAE